MNPTFMARPLLLTTAVLVGHSGRAAQAASAGIHNPKSWLWISGIAGFARAPE
jgi:hypothetical protein